MGYHVTEVGHRVRRRVDDVRRAPQGVGLPPGPAAHHAPDRRHRGRPGGGPAELRRHHLRQGRVGAQAAHGLRRGGGVLRRRPRLLRPPRVRQHRAGRPARLPGAVVRARPAGLVARLAGDVRHLPARPRASRPARTAGSPGSRDPDRDRPGDRRVRRPPAPRGHRPVRAGRRRAAARPVDRDRRRRGADRDPGGGRRTGRAGARQRRRPQLRQGAPRRRLAGHRPRAPGHDPGVR